MNNRKVAQELLKLAKSIEGKSAMDRKYDKLVKDLRRIRDEYEADMGEYMDDSAAYDIAQNILDDNRWLEKYLKSIGVRDTVDHIADYI
jgi:hypothetical protein